MQRTVNVALVAWSPEFSQATVLPLYIVSIMFANSQHGFIVICIMYA